MKSDNIKQALRPGEILQGRQSRYRIMQAIGQGTFGITYLAEIIGADGNSSGMLVCIKEFFMRDINGRQGSIVSIRSQSGLFDSYRSKFEREARNLATIVDDNIIRIIESFQANNTAYYAMSFIAGGSLDELIESSERLPERRALEIAHGIACALRTLHRKGMAHLDLKPANVMMFNGRIPVLIDFGLSKHFSPGGHPESSTTIGLGTPGYSPMEQSNYHEGVDLPWPMDIYALGATMFKMLSGRRAPVASDIYNDGFPTMEFRDLGVTPGTIAIMRKAMSPIKDLRYQTADEIIVELNEELSDATSTSQNPASEETRFDGQEHRHAAETENARPQFATVTEASPVAEIVEATPAPGYQSPRTSQPHTPHPRQQYAQADASPATARPAVRVSESEEPERKKIIPSWLFILLISFVTTAAIVLGVIFWVHKDSDNAVESEQTESTSATPPLQEILASGSPYTIQQISGEGMPAELRLSQKGEDVAGTWHTRVADIGVEGSFRNNVLELRCRTTSMRLEIRDNGDGTLTGIVYGPGAKKSEATFKRID